jgi:hypothetical protein
LTGAFLWEAPFGTLQAGTFRCTFRAPPDGSHPWPSHRGDFPAGPLASPIEQGDLPISGSESSEEEPSHPRTSSAQTSEARLWEITEARERVGTLPAVEVGVDRK